jgi:DegV family protein with EDD domain
MTIKIVTDSGADVPSELVKSLGIVVVPLGLSFGDKTYLDGVDLSSDEFYEKLINDGIMPKTTQPSVGQFIEVYKELKKSSHQILSIHISAKLSGTFNSATQAATEEKLGDSIKIIDSKQASIALGFSVIAAAQAVAKGASLEEAASIAESTSDRTDTFILFDTLEYLLKGGRIGRANALIGGVLKIKPILTLDDGEIATKLKIRTLKKGIQSLQDLAEECGDLESAAVLYTTDSTEPSNLAGRIRNKFVTKSKPSVIRLSPAIGTHGGPGVIGVVCVKAKP